MRPVLAYSVAVFVMTAMSAMAIEQAASKTDTKAASVKKSCCHKGAATAATTSKHGCCSKGAKAVATTTVETKSGKPCCASKNSTTVTVATTAAESPCSKGEKTVATAQVAASPHKPCCASKNAKSVAVVSSGKKGCCSKGKTSRTTLASGSDVKGLAVLASMPQMTYQVGDVNTPCFKTATEMAEKSHSTIAYVVGDKSYGCRGEASVALAGLVSKKNEDLLTVKYVVGGEAFVCPHAASGAAERAHSKMLYRVAGRDFNDKDLALKLADKARKAAEAVTMAYEVDGKVMSCSKTAKSSGKTVTYLVGEEETECEKTARLMLAELIARTIVETVDAISS